MGRLDCGATAVALLVAQRIAGPGEINHAFVDPYSMVHALVGVITAALGLGIAPTLLIAVGWEFAEHLLKNLVPVAFPHPTQDTLANSMGDVLSTALGWTVLTVGLRARARRRARASAP
jgi:hypothetical protein